MSYPRFLPVGDSAVTVEFGDAISSQLNEAVVALDIALAAAELDGIVETVPSYRSLLICYDPSAICFADLVDALKPLLARHARVASGACASWIVPVIYDPPYADDVPELAERLALSADQVVAIHTQAEYKVYTVGFAPGMPYLGGLEPALHIPRRQAPRPRVPAGAIMIGGIQACIVPIPYPSAWYILGQTPLRPFDLSREDPFLFRAGDVVRFRRVDAGEFAHLAALPAEALLSVVRATRHQ